MALLELYECYTVLEYAKEQQPGADYRWRSPYHIAVWYELGRWVISIQHDNERFAPVYRTIEDIGCIDGQQLYQILDDFVYGGKVAPYHKTYKV